MIQAISFNDNNRYTWKTLPAPCFQKFSWFWFCRILNKFTNLHLTNTATFTIYWVTPWEKLILIIWMLRQGVCGLEVMENGFCFLGTVWNIVMEYVKKWLGLVTWILTPVLGFPWMFSMIFIRGFSLLKLLWGCTKCNCAVYFLG